MWNQIVLRLADCCARSGPIHSP